MCNVEMTDLIEVYKNMEHLRQIAIKISTNSSSLARAEGGRLSKMPTRRDGR